MSLTQIISGGQTGVDRGALDAAIELGIDHGGVCPRGRLAEDGRIPNRYALTELSSRKYAVRTEQNVFDSDATLIMYNGSLSGGTAFTHRMCIKNRKPFLLFDLTKPLEIEEVTDWLTDNAVCKLNCAGPRESANPGIQSVTQGLCKELFAAAMDCV